MMLISAFYLLLSGEEQTIVNLEATKPIMDRNLFSFPLNLEISNFYMCYITQFRPNLMCQINNYLHIFFLYTASSQGQLLKYFVDKCLIDKSLEICDFFLSVGARFGLHVFFS